MMCSLQPILYYSSNLLDFSLYVHTIFLQVLQIQTQSRCQLRFLESVTLHRQVKDRKYYTLDRLLPIVPQLWQWLWWVLAVMTVIATSASLPFLHQLVVLELSYLRKSLLMFYCVVMSSSCVKQRGDKLRAWHAILCINNMLLGKKRTQDSFLHILLVL